MLHSLLNPTLNLKLKIVKDCNQLNELLSKYFKYLLLILSANNKMLVKAERLKKHINLSLL